jgi:hypothetical protein
MLDAAFRTQHVDGLGLLDRDGPDIVLHRSSARSRGVMEHSAFVQCMVEHRATEILPGLHICSGVHDYIDRHRNVPQHQAKSGLFLDSIYDGRDDHE